MAETNLIGPYLRDAYNHSVVLKSTGKPYAVDCFDVLLEEAETELDRMGYYHEGGSLLGSGIYDLKITPRNIFEERGICTEHEGHLRVAIDHNSPKFARIGSKVTVDG